MGLDHAALNELLQVIGGERAMLVELIESFEQEGPRIMRDMIGAAEAGDLVALRRAAHTMKSSARDFGATHLSELCAALEHHMASATPVIPTDQVAAIADEFSAALSELAAFKAD